LARGKATTTDLVGSGGGNFIVVDLCLAIRELVFTFGWGQRRNQQGDGDQSGRQGKEFFHVWMSFLLNGLVASEGRAPGSVFADRLRSTRQYDQLAQLHARSKETRSRLP